MVTPFIVNIPALVIHCYCHLDDEILNGHSTAKLNIKDVVYATHFCMESVEADENAIVFSSELSAGRLQNYLPLQFLPLTDLNSDYSALLLPLSNMLLFRL